MLDKLQSHRFAIMLATASIIVGAWSGLSRVQADSQASFRAAIQPASPLEITVLDTHAPSPDVPDRVRDKAVGQSYAVKNVSNRSVLGYAIRWSDTNQPGQQGRCTSQLSFVPSKVLLAPGETKSLDKTVTINDPEVAIELNVDFVLLDDGTAYGANQCRQLERLQDMLAGRGGFRTLLLHILDTQGVEALVQALHDDEAAEARRRQTMLLPKFSRKQ